MAFLNGLFALLSVVLFILLFVALIKPSIFKIKTRLKAFLIFCAAIIVCLVLWGSLQIACLMRCPPAKKNG